MHDVYEPPRGERNLIQLVTYRVEATPTAAYGSMPVDEDDVTKGFKDISWAEFGNAVDHAVEWLRGILPEQIDYHETVGYTGPRDIRYAILIVAAAKLERKLLVPGPSLTVAAQKKLAESTKCKIWLYGGSFEKPVREVADAVLHWEVKVVGVPEVSELITDVRAPIYKWEKTWEQTKKYPCLVVHTSGTTGLPKPVVYTHEALMVMDINTLMPEYLPGSETFENLAPGCRYYSPLPTLHIVGVYVALIWPACFGSTIVFGPTTNITPNNVQLMIDTMHHGRCSGALFVPVFLDEFAKTPAGLAALKRLDHIFYGGSSCRPSTLRALDEAGVHTISGYGTTEAGGCVLRNQHYEDGEIYFDFCPSLGFAFEQRDGDLHELVQIRSPQLLPWQTVFMIYPHLERFPLGDLFVESQTRPGFWKIAGRTDDLVVFVNSNKLNAIHVEDRLWGVPELAGVVVGGSGRSKPFVLVEWRGDEADDAEKLEKFWPVVQRVNETLAPSVRIQRELVLFAKRDKPLPRNIKDGVVRRRAEELYSEEIRELYRGVVERVY